MKVIWEEGDIVEVNLGGESSRFGCYADGDVGIVQHEGTQESHLIKVKFNGLNLNVHPSEIKLADNKKLEAFEAKQPKKLKVDTLAYQIIVDNKCKKIIVGCQEISFSSALLIADFIKKEVSI